MLRKTSWPTVFAVLVCFSFMAAPAHADVAKSNYVMTDTIHLPGAVRWDLLTFDANKHRLFIARGDSVDVVDMEAKKIIGSIPADGAHGVALAPEFGKGFISNGKSNTLTVFDLETLKPISTIPTGTKPDVVVYDDQTKQIFAANADSGDITAINAKDGTVVGAIKLDGQPEFIALDGKGKLFVNLEDKSQIDVVDLKTLKVINHFDLAPQCEEPTGLAIDKAHNRLFSVCANKNMLVVDAGDGKIINTLPIGQHSDGAAFDEAAGLAFSSNGDGTLTVVGMDNGHYKVAQTIQTKVTARTMTLDPLTHTVYLAAAETEGFDPPSEKHPEPRPHVKPDTFMVLVIGTKL